jgi:hypothetical protein
LTGSPSEPALPSSPCIRAITPTVGWYGSLIGGTCMDDPAQSVCIPPGSSTVTLMPSGLTSCARTSEKPPTAHFAAW